MQVCHTPLGPVATLAPGNFEDEVLLLCCQHTKVREDEIVSNCEASMRPSGNSRGHSWLHGFSPGYFTHNLLYNIPWIMVPFCGSFLELHWQLLFGHLLFRGLIFHIMVGSLHVGDEILEINGTNVTNHSVDQLQKAMVGIFYVILFVKCGSALASAYLTFLSKYLYLIEETIIIANLYSVQEMRVFCFH